GSAWRSPAAPRYPAPGWGGGQGGGQRGQRGQRGAAPAVGSSVETEVGRGLRECGGRGWGGARRRGGAGAGKGGEDGLDGEGVLHGGDDAQPAATAGTGEDVEVEHAAQQGRPGPRVRGAGGAGASVERARAGLRVRAA